MSNDAMNLYKSQVPAKKNGFDDQLQTCTAAPRLIRDESMFKTSDFIGLQSMDDVLASQDTLPEETDKLEDEEEEEGRPSDSAIASFLNARVATFLHNVDTIAGMVVSKEENRTTDARNTQHS